MDAATRRTVRERARDRCEYCLLAQEHSPLAALQIEHIRPLKHSGTDDPDNLALACIDCNLSKGPNLTGVDSITGAITPLYNPRQDRWIEHFEFQGPLILGKTATGRATVAVLNMNSDEQITLRSLLPRIDQP